MSVAFSSVLYKLAPTVAPWLTSNVDGGMGGGAVAAVVVVVLVAVGGVAFGAYAYLNKIACFAGEEGVKLNEGAELQGNSKV